MSQPRPIPAAIAAIAPDGQLTVAQKRRLILDLALKRVKLGSGSPLEFMRRRKAIKTWPNLRPILTDILWVAWKWHRRTGRRVMRWGVNILNMWLAKSFLSYLERCFYVTKQTQTIRYKSIEWFIC